VKSSLHGNDTTLALPCIQHYTNNIEQLILNQLTRHTKAIVTNNTVPRISIHTMNVWETSQDVATPCGNTHAAVH